MSKEKSLKDSRESSQKILASATLNDLLESHNLDETTFKSLLTGLLSQLGADKEDNSPAGIPVSIFTKQLTVLESLVKYFVEEKKLPLRKVASILNRNEKNLWHTYNNAKKKFSGSLELNSTLYVPETLIAQSLGSPTEALVLYLHDELDLSYAKIGQLLDRNQRTIWTTYKRAKVKYEKT